ncbi:MAG: haloacid dehalogenase type II [Ectothiorhodospiraceae bacterium]|nr:haloacid dehalogenase type II [Chromatiales bacterium]MCP5154702.1 haloacid dehalogenase type II [Ectothiorhodospiraceae bacterium]
MAELAVDGIRCCVFDAYGTLFDVHSAVGRHRARLGEQADRVSELWRRKQLEYTWLRSLMDRFEDFWVVTGHALDHAMETCGVDDAALREDLMQAYLGLDCYPEVPAMLARLRELGMRTAILSNGSQTMLDAAVASAGLGDAFDAVLSVDALGIFKPHPSVYQLALDRLGVEAGEVCFQSSNAWDVAGAATFGFNVVWINRFGQARERLPGEPAAELRSLEGLPGLVSGA